MFKKVLIIFIFTLFGLLVFSHFSPKEDTPTPDLNDDQATEKIIHIGNTEITIEIADEPNEQMQGLSDRPSLDQDRGMLFIFPQPATPGFWMKDMKFSLDLLWIDENKKIIEITKNVSPATYPKSFLPSSPIKYVLEVNSGWTDMNKIKLGDKVTGI